MLGSTVNKKNGSEQRPLLSQVQGAALKFTSVNLEQSLPLRGLSVFLCKMGLRQFT